MKTLYKLNYNVICDGTRVTPYDCEEKGATYECIDSGRRFQKNAINSLKKVDGGYEMISDNYEQGMVDFMRKIINAMEDTLEQYQIKAGECKLILERAKSRQKTYVNCGVANNE